MSQELHYTSVPRGLRPGTRGFCTVAMTPQITGPLFERLENLSGYQPVYPPHDPAAALNPVNFAHLRFSLGGRPVSILSRVGPAGLDYTGRANKYAHHVVLDAAERPDGGPAWLLAQPGFMHGAWDGDPRMLDEGRPVPRGDRPGGIATAWAALTGDAGWAGVLAEAFLTDPKRPAFIVFRPGMDLLPLFAEAIALLPPSRRWDVEFSTYLTQAPRGISYAWRGVLEGSPEAANARRLPGALVIDLCGAPKRAEGGPLVHTARTGEHREWTGMPAASQPVPSIRDVAAPPGRPVPIAGSPPREATADPPGNYELIPKLAARLAEGRGASYGIASPMRERGRGTGVLIIGLVLACVIPLITAGVVFRNKVVSLLGLNQEIRAKTEEIKKVVADKRQEYEKSASQQAAAPVASVAPTAPAPRPKEPPAEVAHRPSPKMPEAVTDKPLVATAEPRHVPANPKVFFLQIPEVGDGGGVKDPTHDCSISLEGMSASLAKLITPENQLYLLDEFLISSNSKNTIDISMKSESLTSDPSCLATFSIKDGVIRFAWGRSTEGQRKLAEPLLSSVLLIEDSHSVHHYVMMRDPGVIPNNGPLSLSRSRPDPRATYSERGGMREASFQWASDRATLRKAKWELFIRKWRIMSWLKDNGKPLLISSGERSAPGGPINEDLIPKEVNLSLKFDETQNKKENVRVIIKLTQPNPERLARNKAISDFLKSYAKDDQGEGGVGRAERQTGDAADHDERTEERLRAIEARFLAELARLVHRTGDSHSKASPQSQIIKEIEALGNDSSDHAKKARGELEDLRTRFDSLDGVRKQLQINLKEDCLDRAVRSELSLVISMKADRTTIIDIASFGDWQGTGP